MVSTRRAQASATPPATPSAVRQVDIAQNGSSSSSSNKKKMSREMQRLLIDGNPKMGGLGSSTSRKSRRSDVGQSQLEESPAPRQGQELLAGGRDLLTPPPSDSPNSPNRRHLHRPPAHAAPAATSRPPSPAANQSQPTTSNARPSSPLKNAVSTKSPDMSTKPKPSNKRTIHDYFSAAPQHPPTKRRKLDSPVHNTASPTFTPVPAVESISAPVHVAQPDPQPEDAQNMDIDPPAVEGAPNQPDQTPGTDQDQEILQEKEHTETTEGKQHDQEQDKEQEAEEQKTKAKAKEKKARELARLTIDANAAILGSIDSDDDVLITGQKRKRPSRRQTTLPPRHQHSEGPPGKRIRHSLPVAGSSAALPGPSYLASDEDAPTVRIPTWEEVNYIGSPIPNPTVVKPNNEPKFLDNGEVNDAWLTPWLAGVAQICGDHDTEKALLGDAAHSIAADRRKETEEEKRKRVHRELDILESMPIIRNPDEQAGPADNAENDNADTPKQKGKKMVKLGSKATPKATPKAAGKKTATPATANSHVLGQVSSTSGEVNGDEATSETPRPASTKGKAKAKADKTKNIGNNGSPAQPTSYKGKGKAKVI